MRAKIINWAIAFIFIFLSLSLLNLAIIQGRNLRDLSDKNCIRLLAQQASRGKILDRQGDVIVDNRLSYDVMLLPQGEARIDKILMKISEVLGESFEDLKDAFRSGFNASFMPIAIAKNIDVKKAIALEELKVDLGGIIIQPHPIRYYPYGRLACHVIGYLNEIDHWRLTKLADYGYKTKDIVGFGGVEEKYDYLLRQNEGGLSMEVDHKGRFVRTLGFKSPQNGRDITLTLDLKLQKIAEEALGSRSGSVVIMEPYTGEIIAMANSPNFNPAAFVKKTDGSLWSNLFDNPQAPLINRSISGMYPAGSVFKLIVATGALETGKINLATEFFCSGSTNVGKQKFSCWDTHNQQNLMQAISHSCNVFFYKTGLILGGQSIHDYGAKFAFGKPTGVDLPYEASGFLPDPLWKRVSRLKNWFDGDTANFAIGQGDLLVTPLQIARMMAVFANKGILVTPYIVKAIDNKDISVYQKKIIRLPIKESTINYIRKALRNTVLDPRGTANILSETEVSVAGKTGTAQVSRGQAHGWFVGFFPFQNPKFVICVFLEHGGSGQASCVVTREILTSMVKEGLI